MLQKNNFSSKAIYVLIAVAVFYLLANFTPLGSMILSSDKNLEAQIGQYILDNPEKIIESIQNMQAKQQEMSESQVQKALSENAKDLTNIEKSPYIGNPEGDVMIVEFFDYNCGYCKQVNTTLQKVIAKDTKVKVVFRELPILHETSEKAARAALSVWYMTPEKYLDFHNLLMGSKEGYDLSSLKAKAKKLGIDADKMVEGMNSSQVDAELQYNQRLAKLVGVRGTPAFVIGSQYFAGAMDYNNFVKIIADERSKLVASYNQN